MDDTRRNDTTEEKIESVEQPEIQEDETKEIEQEEKRDIGGELVKVQEIATQLENQLKRSLADYQNLQKRVQDEKASWIRMANKELLLKLLPVLDTLMLAHKHLSDKGLELSISQFLQVLKDEGVSKIETVGEDFDPNTMEATGTRSVDSGQAAEGEEGKVIEEVRSGFMYYDVVLRPAQVIVGA